MQVYLLLSRHKLTLLALAVTAAVIAAYWQTFSRIVDMWSITDYQHGWLVYPVSLYVLMKKRDALALAHWRVSTRGFLLVVLLVLIWTVARAVGIQIIEFASATMLVFALYWALAGTDAARIAAFPLLLLLASVPMGAFLVEPMMYVTADIASGLLHLAGVPALRNGQFFDLPGGSFEIADVCSGLRYLLAGAMAALAYAYVTYSSNAKRLLFVGLTAIVLVITNGVRAFIVMAVASATDMEILGGRDHVVFGMVLFAVVFIAMIWVGEAYADPTYESRHGRVGHRNGQNSLVSTFLVTSALVAVIAGPVFGSAMTNRGAAPIADMPLPSLDNCLTPGHWSSIDSPVFARADYLKHGLFACDNYQAGVYVASYGEQHQGKELIAWGNRLWPNYWRRYVERSTTSISTSDGTAHVREILVRHPAGWRLIWYWYQVGTSVTSSQYRVKFLETLRALTLQPVESSVVVVTAISNNYNNEAELRQQLEVHAEHVMSWNRERVERGERQ